MVKISAVIAAAGSGKRMKTEKNKQWIPLQGIPMLARTLSVFQNCAVIDEIVIASAADEIDDVRELVRQYALSKVTAVIPGGETRQKSVWNALHAAQGEIVLIHDGARPFVKDSEIRAVADGVVQFGSAALGMKVKDTIKEIRPDGIVKTTLPREHLLAAATPQGFFRNRLIALHQMLKNTPVTDDCMLAELAGDPVKMILCGEQNIKITTPEDLFFAEQYLEQQNN